MSLDLSKGSESHHFIRAATAIISHLYPLQYTNDMNTLDSEMKESRCIETARALHETLQAFKLPSKLLPVDLLVQNPLAFKLSRDDVPISDWPEQAWSVGVMDSPNAKAENDKRTGGWEGHMLVRVARDWLCDPNAGQFFRPGKINMPDAWTIQYPKKEWAANSYGWALVGVVTSETPTPMHPEFPILNIRQRPDNDRWQGGTAATVNLDSIIDLATEILARLRAGDLSNEIFVTSNIGAEVNIDFTQVIARYQGATE
jgi:hypothetical protein